MRLALDFPAIQEWIIIAVVAVLLFGRRLPEVIAQVLSVVKQVRRQLDDLRRSTGFDEDLREAQRAIEDARRTVRSETRALTAPKFESPTAVVRREAAKLESEVRDAGAEPHEPEAPHPHGAEPDPEAREPRDEDRTGPN
ncbi:MAG: twin-arginine translocase TatA/TatE family subunit [Planctomycetota bacterium]